MIHENKTSDKNGMDRTSGRGTGRFELSEVENATRTRSERGGWSPTITTESNVCRLVSDEPIFRRLTPREYWRLMGFDDEDFDKAEQVCSNSQLYKQAGNSIVVDVLMAIFGEMI